MIKTILIVSDFSVESLYCVENLLSNNKNNTRFSIIFLYGADSTEYSIDLLFYSKSRIIRDRTKSGFDEALDALKSTYSSKIYAAKKEVFFENYQIAFDNFLSFNQVSEIYLPECKVDDYKGNNNIFKFIKNSGLPIHYTRSLFSTEYSESGLVA